MMDDLEKDPLVTSTEVTVYKRRWYILLGTDHIYQLWSFYLTDQILEVNVRGLTSSYYMRGACSVLSAGNVPVHSVEHLGSCGGCGQHCLPLLDPGHHLPPGQLDRHRLPRLHGPRPLPAKQEPQEGIIIFISLKVFGGGGGGFFAERLEVQSYFLDVLCPIKIL